MAQISLKVQHDLVLGIVGFLRQRANELSRKHLIPERLEDDLFSELTVTALEMAPWYEPKKGGFVTYIWKALNSTARAFAAENAHPLSYPASALKSNARVRWAIAEQQRRGVAVTEENVAELAKENVSMAAFFMDSQNTPRQAVSMSTPITGRDEVETLELGDLLPSQEESPEARLLRIEIYHWVLKSLHYLTSSELRALLAYALYNLSYAEIGRQLGVSKQRGEQLVLTAGDRVRHCTFGGHIERRRVSGGRKSKQVRVRRTSNTARP